VHIINVTDFYYVAALATGLATGVEHLSIVTQRVVVVEDYQLGSQPLLPSSSSSSLTISEMLSLALLVRQGPLHSADLIESVIIIEV
jgi:hypothetical protein